MLLMNNEDYQRHEDFADFARRVEAKRLAPYITDKQLRDLEILYLVELLAKISGQDTVLIIM